MRKIGTYTLIRKKIELRLVKIMPKDIQKYK
jgi:hypothetical protein